jgi:hypothetical protein
MAGRPLRFQNVNELQTAIDGYFATRFDGAGNVIRPVTITGLALALDTTRQVLMDYQGREEFTDAIKRAKLRCECYAEEQLFIGRNSNGAQFALKNYGWKDQQHVEVKEITLLSDDELNDRLSALDKAAEAGASDATAGEGEA